ncbi:MAG: F0F1 ATP synthase subunit A [Lactobacillus sp.]|nr:F0F1 ATP synthase subunit A [Lactobacillus sp.]
MEKSFVFQFLGMKFEFAGLVGSTLCALVVYFLCKWLAKKVEVRPNKRQNVLEMILDFTNGIVKGNVEESSMHKQLSLYAFTLFLFVWFMNQLGLFLELKVGEYTLIKSPTADPVTTMTLAMMTMLIAFTAGVNKFGFGGYLKNYAGEVIFLAPLNVIEELTNFLTLALRLYGNIFAGEVLLTLIGNSLAPSLGITTWILAAPLAIIWQGFSVFIGSIQAYVFVTLSMVYIGKKVVKE